MVARNIIPALYKIGQPMIKYGFDNLMITYKLAACKKYSKSFHNKTNFLCQFPSYINSSQSTNSINYYKIGTDKMTELGKKKKKKNCIRGQ